MIEFLLCVVMTTSLITNVFAHYIVFKRLDKLEARIIDET